jgi:hypothetical protein
MKVTDPKDERFNVERFDFDDYLGDVNLASALKDIFPPGTERTFVNHILIDIAGAKVNKQQEIKTDEKVFYHGFPNSYRNIGWSYSPVVTVEFQNDKVQKLFVHGEPVDEILKFYEDHHKED